MEIHCIDCGTRLSSWSLDSRTQRFRCRRCGTSFRPEGLPGKPLPPTFSAPALVPVERHALSIPSGVRISREGKDLRLQRRWFQWSILPLAVFASCWNAFMVVWYAISFSTGMWLMALFGVFHAAIGAAMAYSVLAGLFNVTTLEVRGERLRISHFPFYWGAATELEVRDLLHFYVRANEEGHETGAGNYQLHAVQANGAHVKLLENLDLREQALFLEQELGSFLGVSRDRPRGSALPATRTPSREGVEISGEPAPQGSVSVEQVHLLEGADCPVCGDDLGQAPTVCPRCSTPHHQDCWHYGGGCSTYGCPEGPGGRA